MATLETYPVNSKVRIKDPGKKPSNWNPKMVELIGATATIRLASGPGKAYRYYLTGWDWTWRHCDLELLELPKLDPNREFRNKKHYGVI